MATFQYLQPGEPLPEGHQCHCYECHDGRFPPEDVNPTPAETARGHFKAGCYVALERVELDGVPNGLVMECQAEGDEPWALIVNEPIHRCRNCGGGRACRGLVFPKRIDVTISATFRESWERFRARELGQPSV